MFSWFYLAARARVADILSIAGLFPGRRSSDQSGYSNDVARNRYREVPFSAVYFARTEDRIYAQFVQKLVFAVS